MNYNLEKKHKTNIYFVKGLKLIHKAIIIIKTKKNQSHLWVFGEKIRMPLK